MNYPYVQARNHGGAQDHVNRIVIHATVSPTRDFASKIANYFHTTNRQASAHYVVDQGHIVQCLTERTVGWHAPPNTGSIGIELCDPQTGPGTRWSDADHDRMLRLAAKLVREIAGRWKVPLMKVSAAGLRNGHLGICGHADVSAAWHLTDHTDPGTAFPWTTFMGYVHGGPTTNWAEALVTQLPTLKRGQAQDSEDVQTLQGLLLARSHPEIKVDGSFGATTEIAVKAVQAWRKLIVDGVVGPKTWQALLRL